MPRFSLRTLLTIAIVSPAMAAILFAQPWTEVVNYSDGCFPPPSWRFTSRFAITALAELGAILAWAFIATSWPRGTPKIVWKSPDSEKSDSN